jgi:hypothetical protein
MEWFLDKYLEVDPQCLFCKSHCDVESYGLAIPTDVVHRDILTCTACGEYYQVFVFDSSKEGAPIKKDFAHIVEFSCGGVVIALSEEAGCLAIRARSADENTEVNIPEFELDITDKQKLQEKLKTYLIFS